MFVVVAAAAAVVVIIGAAPVATSVVILQLYCRYTGHPIPHPTHNQKSTQSAVQQRLFAAHQLKLYATSEHPKKDEETRESSSIPNAFTYDCYSYYTETILRDL